MLAPPTTREQILLATRDLFLRHGLNGFSMRTVADRVGVSATALYRHFDDKEALLASLLGEAFGVFGSYLGRSLAGRTPLERFRRCGAEYIAFAVDHPHEYELMFLTNCSERGLETLQEEVEQRSRPTFEMLVDRVEECMAAGVFTRADSRPTALFAWATLHGLASLWLLGQLKESMDAAAFHAHAESTLDRIELSLSAPHRAKRR